MRTVGIYDLQQQVHRKDALLGQQDKQIKGLHKQVAELVEARITTRITKFRQQFDARIKQLLHDLESTKAKRDEYARLADELAAENRQLRELRDGIV